MGQSMLDCPITIGVRMTKQLELNLSDDWHCSTCDEFTKPDEWTDFDNRVCINCASEIEADVWEDYQQRKSDTVISG